MKDNSGKINDVDRESSDGSTEEYKLMQKNGKDHSTILCAY